MSHESLPLDEVTWRARWMVGSFWQEDIDRVPMRPTQGFEPLVSVVCDSLKFFCFQTPSTNSVEAYAQDLSVVKETWPRRRRRTLPRSVKSGRPSSRRH
jgi:hypothetical protein